MLYSSHTASPAPAISVDFTRASGTPTPDSLQICVSVASISLVTCQYSTPPAAGTTRRYTRLLTGWTSQPTGRYPYVVEVATVTSGVRASSTRSGTLSVVNRHQSPYGAGWWLSGIDQVVGTPSTADTLLWVGADGSTRSFGSIGTLSGIKRFVARSLDRPDTIFFNGSASTLYRRHDNDRYTTYFSPTTGYYSRTESTYGQTVDQCTSMASDGFCSAWTMDATYTLHRSASVLDSIVAPAATGSSARRVKLARSGYQVTGITDPDNTVVGFAYASGTNRVSSRTDKRSSPTTFAWTNARLSGFVQDAGGLHAATAVTPAEVAGAGTGPGASLDSAYTEINGPRSDVDDRTRIWINGYGAAVRVRDPQGNESRVTYDSTWPLLAKSTRNPLRLQTLAFYNNRGLTDSTLVIGMLGGADTSRTRFVWHSKWRSPIRVTDPVGLKDTSAYDATHGTVTFRQRGSSSGRRVSFTYGSSGITAGLVRSIVRPPSNATDSVFYDANGNLSRTRSAIGFTTVVYRDGAGRDTTTFSPIDSLTGRDSTNVVTHGVRSVVRYDAMGRPTTELTVGPARTAARSISHPRDSVTLTHTYDSEGNRTGTARTYRQSGFNTTLYTYWVWDKLGRVTTYTSPSASNQSYTYDLAGNQTQRTTGRGFNITTQFDALGRPTRRISPEVTYSSRHCSTLPAQNPSCMYSFPTHGSSVCIPADTARFRYDAAGQLVQANNRWSRIRRINTPAGLVKADSQRTRAWWVASNAGCETAPPSGVTATPVASAFTGHVYGLEYTYDLAGRRTRLDHPNAIDPCSGRCFQRYGYHAVAGTLDTVVAADSTVHRFVHDDGGRVTSRVAPGSITDARTYDLDDRLVRRTITGVVADTLQLDAQGRPHTVRSGY
nr:hypothetical protein [Gemmatimonadaceae bacterium]